MLADKGNLARSLTALTFIQNLTNVILLTRSLNYFLKIEDAALAVIKHFINSINQFSLISFSISKAETKSMDNTYMDVALNQFP